MKKLFFFLSFCLFHFISQAQAPQGIPYQSVVRNGSGALISNQPVSIRFSIHDSTMQGTIVYQETHNTNTSNGGMVILNIGQGTPVTGTFSAINWGVNAKFMQVELDTTATGNNYVDLGTQQMMSVPYALYSNSSAHAENGLPLGGQQGQVITMCEGQAIWTTGGQCPAKVSALDCGNVSSPTLYANAASNGVVSLPYTGGNGCTYTAQSIPSTGITGLNLTLPIGTLANGNGSLSLTLSGTPSAAGTASFNFSLGVQTCTLNLTVNPPIPIYCNSTNVFNPSLSYGTMVDQDGNTYKTIQIGNQEWMAENLRTGHYRNGDAIPVEPNNTIWGNLSTGAFCWYNNDSASYNCPYGRIYNWFAVADSRNVCPLGWHVPTEIDLNKLSNFLEPGLDTNLIGWQGILVGNMIKASGNYYWLSLNTATNVSGFSGLPSGGRHQDGSFNWLGTYGGWWSSTSLNATNAFRRVLYADNGSIGRDFIEKTYGFSVRCIKD